MQKNKSTKTFNSQAKEFKPLFKDPIFDEGDDDYASYATLARKKIHRVAKAFEIVRANPDFHLRHMSTTLMNMKGQVLFFQSLV